MDVRVLMEVDAIVIAVMGYGMRKMMEAVNFGELEHLRYQYKGA